MKKSIKISYNKTKIVATVGPSSNTKDMLRALICEGVDVFRMNFSHSSHNEHQKVVDTVRKLNIELGLHTALLLDLQGPKIRVGDMQEGTLVKNGQLLTITTRKALGDSALISIPYKGLSKEVKSGESILIDDGRIELRVVKTEGSDIVARVVRGGVLSSRKGVNLPDSRTQISSLTPKDLEDIEFGIHNRVDWVALSFVRKAGDVHALRKLLLKRKSSARIIAKIEKPEAVHNIDQIIEAADAIMVARGDLGVEVWMGEVPMIQKKIIEKCNRASKPVIVATQIMESMIHNPQPTRAETNDVANAVMDGADALMLSAETAVGAYPLEVINSMMRTIGTVERQANIYYRFQEVGHQSPIFIHDSLILTAARLAQEVNAKAIVGMTASGYTAYKSSAHRPKANIFAFTGNREIINTLSLVWGVRTYFYDKQTTTDDTIRDVGNILKRDGHLKKGDVFISLASMPIHERHRTNMMKINKVE